MIIKRSASDPEDNPMDDFNAPFFVVRGIAREMVIRRASDIPYGIEPAMRERIVDAWLKYGVIRIFKG